MTGLPARSRRRNGARGLATLEIVISLMPLLLAFLGVAQLALIQHGRLVVESACQRAARAAVVVLDDDPTQYGNAPRGDLMAGAASSKPALLSLLGGSVPSGASGTSGALGKAKAQGGARLQAIRQAAYAPLATVAPPSFADWAFGGASLGDAVSEGPLRRLAIGLAVYGPAAAAITLRGGPEKDGQPGPVLRKIGPTDTLTVRVAFLLPCRVPLAKRLVCVSAGSILTSGLNPLASERSRRIRQELEHVASPGLSKALLASGGYFSLVVTETTVQNQGAQYHTQQGAK